jgi:Protein of unknown function (DUF4232)
MEDEELRARFAALFRPVEQMRVPDVSVIRRRLRRRRAGQTTAGLLACAAVVASAGLIHQALGAPAPVAGPMPNAAGCANDDLQIGWLPPAGPKGLFMEAPPETYLLSLRNTGATACSLKGWPRLAMASSRPPRLAPVSYGTLSTLFRPGASETSSRIVEPTQVVLMPGAAALSAVTVALPPLQTGCVRTAWAITSPLTGSSPARRPPGGPPQICDGTSIVVSPIYPGSVPLSQNYPRSALAASPAITTNPAPPATAGPGVAPYFITIDHARTPSPAVVRAWRTGAITATVQAPAGSGPGGFTGIAGAGDDATFVLAAGTGHSRFYQLGLWRGTAEPLVPLPVPPLATSGTPFAVSADGSSLALALTARGGGGKIVVVSLVTGSTRRWVSPGPGLVTALSWAGNSQLMFSWTNTARRTKPAMDHSGLRLLYTARPGTSLLSSRLLIAASVRFGTLRGISYPLASTGGTVLFATMTSQAVGAAQAAVVEFSAASGRPLRMVTPLTGESGFGTWCGALWTDPSGKDALAACGTQGQIRDGSFTSVNLHFPAPNFSAGQDFFAW